MKECHFTAANSPENQRSLQRLLRAIALSKGQFSLILVRCNYGQLREQILATLRSLTKDINLRELIISPSTISLHTAMISGLALDHPAVAIDSQPSAVMVFGLESVITLEDLIINVNQVRDIYVDSFHFPLVLWLQDEVGTLLSRLAPDFKSWAATTIKFEMEKEDLVALVQQETESLFAKVLEADAFMFLSNAAFDLDPKSGQRWEIESASHDLQRQYGVKLEPELEACLEFVLGCDHYANDQIDHALSHFQRSLAHWQQIAGEQGSRGAGEGGSRGAGENNEKSAQSSPQPLSPSASLLPCLPASLPPLLRQAVVLFHLGLCYRRMAEHKSAINRSYWREALSWFRQCLEVLEAAQRQDLVAKFILPACEMLQRLQAWEDLQQLAQKSLDLHQTYGTKAQVAQDYGFLATVSASKSDWLQSYELANTALSIVEVTPEVSRQRESWYLLLLGRAQRHLGESEEAINNLEWAKVVCELQYEPSLYLEILEELRSLYFFEHHNYLEAFNLKQEKIQIEHQYGFRAFIGASQLQPQRHRINPVYGLQKIPSSPDEVAQEIANSGRQQDVNRLIERITRADCKLTVIHGPSGVGKSSILKAGLVPALKQKVIGERLPLPVVLSVYTDWLAAIFCSLNQVIAKTEISLVSEISIDKVIEKLHFLTQHNYTVILIFDQFEEFFFVATNVRQRIQFYKFLSICLDISFVKVILSLREDYLHYLLEFERLSNQKNEDAYDLGVINKNILDKDIRYYLGKFSIQDAMDIINSLTQPSREVINQLVKDLAGELNEVHPIELQIVGAQLQVEKITTLEEYKRCGGSKKLVQRWLEEVIKDCGQENQQISWKLLFELTDEKGTRPLKAKAELATALGRVGRDGGAISSSASPPSPLSPALSLELILEILVGSGLVRRILEESGDHYQLVHDYLVEPIRQKNNYGIAAELEKVRYEKTIAEVAQKLSQEQIYLLLQRRLREARLVGVVLAMMVATIGVLISVLMVNC